jgi:LysR family transcriptional regulator, benzoate and cis,cis-muconate-responsive activator of ben and cat genes
MELRHLRYFVAVGQALNFTKAAMRLHLAQPALRRQVSDPEEELGVDVLKRASKSSSTLNSWVQFSAHVFHSKINERTYTSW